MIFQSVQVTTLIDRDDACNMQLLQDRNTFRWLSITLSSDPAAKLIRIKIHVFSDSTLCVGVSNPDPSNNWATKLDDVWNEQGLVENIKLAAREVQFCWHVLPGTSTIEIEKHIPKYFNGQHPEFFDEGIIFMSMLNDTE